MDVFYIIILSTDYGQLTPASKLSGVRGAALRCPLGVIKTVGPASRKATTGLGAGKGEAGVAVITDGGSFHASRVKTTSDARVPDQRNVKRDWLPGRGPTVRQAALGRRVGESLRHF